jgi:3'(2'), 5'-bisphosphate nucleotidase
MQLEEQKDLNIDFKSDNSPVTNIDIRSNELIVSFLSRTFQNDIIISEESENKPNKESSYWLVDPIDGTKNYIKGGQHFCICISYIHNSYPIFGLIYIPSSKQFYYASIGKGAYLIREDMSTFRINNESQSDNNIYVSTVIRESVVKILNNNFKDSKLVYMSSAIKFVRVAEGKGHFSVRLGPTHEWDTAAGQCIIEECGAYFLDKKLERFTYGLGNKYLNGPFFVVNGNVENHKNSISQCLSLI